MRRRNRGAAGKRAYPRQAPCQVPAAEEALRQTIRLAELDHRLSRLTWFEIGLAAERPTRLDRLPGRRRNRFAALHPEISADRTTFSRVTRVRALTYLLHEVRGLRADLTAKQQLTLAQLARVRWVFGGHPGPLQDYFVSSAGRSDQGASSLLDPLAVEEGLLVQTLKLVRRVPDPVPRLSVSQIRGLSTRHLLGLLTAGRREQNEHILLLGLVAHFYETNPPRN